MNAITAIATTQVPKAALADSSVTQTPAGPPPAPAAELGEASNQERELKVVSIERLEDDARKIISPGRFAVMGYCGDGWTYRENRRAFNAVAEARDDFAKTFLLIAPKPTASSIAHPA